MPTPEYISNLDNYIEPTAPQDHGYFIRRPKYKIMDDDLGPGIINHEPTEPEPDEMLWYEY